MCFIAQTNENTNCICILITDIINLVELDVQINYTIQTTDQSFSVCENCPSCVLFSTCF